MRTYHLNFYDTDPVARGGFEAVQPPQRYGDMEALNAFIARMNGDGFLLHGGLKDGVTSWVPSMIQSNFGASPAFSAAVSMVLPLVNLTGAYLAGWLDHRVFRNEVKTSAALMGLALACLLALPMAVQASLPVSLVLLAATTALMLGVNTMFINVMPVKIGRSSGAAVLSGSLNAITYLGAALATWGIGAAAEGFGWGAVFVLWAVMAGTASQTTGPSKWTGSRVGSISQWSRNRKVCPQISPARARASAAACGHCCRTACAASGQLVQSTGLAFIPGPPFPSHISGQSGPRAGPAAGRRPQARRGGI